MRLITAFILIAFSACAEVKVTKKPLSENGKVDPVKRDLCAISKTTPKAPTVWLTAEQAKQLNRIKSRPYITKMERKGDFMIYTWTNGLHGAVTTQRVEQIISKPARDSRREQFERERNESDKIRKERDALKAENIKLKKSK